MRIKGDRVWDDGEEAWIPAEAAYPSAEDEYFKSLEPGRPDYTPELILGLSVLTEKQRWVIECRYGFRTEGYPMRVGEIADLMGVSHASVVKLIQRAEERLKKVTKIALSYRLDSLGEPCALGSSASHERH